MSDYRYKRVLLKLSGEALMGDGGYGIDPSVTEMLARQIKSIHEDGIEVGIVVGGGNIFRGLAGSAKGMDRAQADYMGMLATVMNALALQDAFEHEDCSCRVMSAIQMNEVCEPYIRRRAMHHLEKGDIVIFAAGSGNPYFTTDTAAALRACEIDADCLLKATKVDGVYDKDPVSHTDAVRFDTISYHEVLVRGLRLWILPQPLFARITACPSSSSISRARIISSALFAESPSAPSSFRRTNNGEHYRAHGQDHREPQAQFCQVRTGRANANILSDITVDYYGVATPISQVAAVKTPEAHMLVIEPWDKALVNAIVKAVSASDLGITPSSDGSIVRLPFPAPTEERRRELVKECRDIAEQARVAIRNIRRDFNNKIERDEELTEDEVRREQAKVQKYTDEYIAKIDELFKSKESEVMEI